MFAFGAGSQGAALLVDRSLPPADSHGVHLRVGWSAKDGILVTDHNVRETLSIVDRAYLICAGKVEVEGTSEFLINDPKSRELYLGPRFSM